MAEKIDPLDPQRHRVYAMEDCWREWSWNTHTLFDLRQLVKTACHKYGVKTPRVTQHKVNSMSYCIPTEDVISFQAVASRPGRGGKNRATALHEVAHYIVYLYFGESVQDHGPTFMGVYLWLLAEAQVAPQAALEAACRAFRINWRPMPPKAVKRTARALRRVVR